MEEKNTIKSTTATKGKGSDGFVEAIRLYLEDLAFADEAFRNAYERKDKSIEECCNYILTQVKQSGCLGFADAEIYGMAVHYYVEDNADLGNIEKLAPTCVVNHKIELSDDEKEKAKKEAIEAYQKQCVEDMKKRTSLKKADAKKTEVEQLSLF